MQTPAFEQSLDDLIKWASQEQIVLMCAKAVPWRCHRSLIGDALLVRDIRTEDIMSPSRRQVHTLTPFAQVGGDTITYPGDDVQQAQLKSRGKHSGVRLDTRTRPVKTLKKVSHLVNAS